MVRKSLLFVTLFALIILFFAQKVESEVNFSDFIAKYEDFLPNQVFIPDSVNCVWYETYDMDYRQYVSCRLDIVDDCYKYVSIYGTFNTITTIMFSLTPSCDLRLGHIIDKFGRPSVSRTGRVSTMWYWDRLLAVSKGRSMYDNLNSKISYFYLR